ncbi:MAG: type II toxin-antitoxin system ParD family antitoxin [Pseudomonadota bacterium]
MVTMNVSLPEPMKTWVERQSRGGRYSNASDYIRDLIRRDQDRQQGIDELQDLIIEGLDSGTPQPFNLADFLKNKQQVHSQRETPDGN